MSIQLLRPEMYGSLVLRSTRDILLETLHGVSNERENMVIAERTSFSKTQLFNCISGLRHSHRLWLLFSRHSQWAVNCFKQLVLMSLILHRVSTSQLSIKPWAESDIHTSRTTSDLATLLQTFQFPASIRLALALHVIVVERLAPVSNKIRCARQWRRRSSDLFDLGDIGGHRGGVHQDTLVEAAFVSIIW